MSVEDDAQMSAAALKAAKKEKKKAKKQAVVADTAEGDTGASTPVMAGGDDVPAEVDTKKAKKDKKKKRKLEELAAADSSAVESSLPSSREATGEGQNGNDEEAARQQRKKEKKEKKRLKELHDQGAGSSAVSAETSANDANGTSANGEQPEKKKRKKSVKGAFGNELKKQKPDQQAANSAPVATTSATPKLSAAQVEGFLKESDLSYEPASSSSTYNPILSFDALPVASGIKAGLSGFAKPTIVQSASWGVQLSVDASNRARDCVAIASTGSGKTLAFGVPILHHILNLPSSLKSSVAALVVAPTRELAMQTQTNLGHISESLGMGIVCLYGGASKGEQVRLLGKKPRIVVGTPGRLLDLASEGSLDLSQVSWLVLDEADRMLDKGFENDIRSIIDQCKPSKASVDGRITSMFSATWPVSVRRLANDFMVDPVRITVGSDELSANTSVKQSVIVLDDGRQKDRKLLDVLRDEGYPSPRYGKQKNQSVGDQRHKVLVFALYKKEAARVATWLERQGYEVGCIQGDLSQDKRTQALEDFRQGRTGVLVATDVAARGLDIPKVELVVNYTFPLLVEDYVHRIGRTGRAGREGRSVTFFTEAEKHLAGELQRVLRDAGAEVPDALAAFGGTIKKKAHAAYGDHYREIDPNIKAKKITFD